MSNNNPYRTLLKKILDKCFYIDNGTLRVGKQGDTDIARYFEEYDMEVLIKIKQANE